ncbi:thiol reductant ABC exporter subunit CydC [Salininema proteolyticum]|uniref:Thiol reductant ABC exporter subunit CydC n=1 Tax=Salininema proteolyticum TaxID=1607685 RepID=A0ABV8U0G5_9ACTN
MRKRLSLAALLGALSQISGIGLIAVSAYLISRAWEQPPILHLMVAITAVRALGLGRGVFRYAERIVSHDTAFRGMESLRVAVWQKLMRLAPSGLPLWRNGDLQTRLIDDVDGVGQRWIRGAIPVITTCITMAVALAVEFAVYPPAGWVMLGAVALAAVVSPALAALAGKTGARATAEARAHLTAGVQSFLAGREELVAAGTADKALHAMDQAQDRLTRAEKRTAWTAGLASASIWLAMGAAVAGALYVGMPAVADGSLRGTLLAVIVLTPLAAFETLQALPQAVQEIGKSRASGRRLTEISETPIPRPDPADPMEDPVDPSMGPPMIEAKNLTLRWPGSALPAVDRLTFKIRPGERIGIQGPSGAGKSTIAAALAGFIPYEGSLRIGGIEFSDLTGDTVRENIALCGQDAYVFDATIAENLKIARPEASDEDLVRALRWAGLRDWFDSLDDGLDTRLGEFGKEVSGGERGRIALARAFLASREVVVIDELDAHLDAALAERVLRTAAAALEGRSAIIISHRDLPDGVADRIIDLQPPAALEPRTESDSKAAASTVAR